MEGFILYTHEGGHLVFRVLGDFMRVAGGTLMQLLLPVAFGARFWLRQERYEAAIVAFWLAASFAGAATYARDALAPDLPLLLTGMSATEEMEAYGETTHDWVNMLDMLGLGVRAARPIAFLLGLAAWLAWAGGLWAGLQAVGVKLPAGKPTKAARSAPPRGRPRTRP